MNRAKPKFTSVFAKPKEETITEMLDAVDQVADKANIGTLVRPDDAPATPEPTPQAQDSNVTPLPNRRPRKVTPAPTQKKTVELPTYLWDELLLKSAKEKITQRYLVLQAFKDAGYTVHDIDLFKDGRRGS